MKAVAKQEAVPVVLVLYVGGRNDAIAKACDCECAIDESCGCDSGYYDCGSDCDMCE